MVLYQEGFLSGIPGGLRHNSREFPTWCCWLPIPQKAAEEVLEAWYYTRHWSGSGPRGLVLHQGGWDRNDPCGGNWIPGNSRLCSSLQIPQNMATTALIPTAARGVDTNGLRHLYQGSVVDGKRLVYWCSKLFTFLYFGHCFSLFINFCHCLICLYRHVDLFIEGDF